jgi:hypothetical protein
LRAASIGCPAKRAQFTDTDPEQFRPDPWDVLPSIPVPVLLIAGTQDDPERTQDAMAVEIPDGRSVHLPGCGHVGAFLRPDDVTAAAYQCSAPPPWRLLHQLPERGLLANRIEIGVGAGERPEVFRQLERPM